MAKQLKLSGRIFREEGMIVAELVELRQSTWAHTLPEVMADVPRLAVEYLESLKELGIFAETIERLGGEIVGGVVALSIHVTIDGDVLPESLPPGAVQSYDSSVAVRAAA